MVSVEESTIIASIIGVAGAGFRLSLILNAVSCEVASEGLEVHSISKTVTLFSLTLKQTGTSLQTSDSVHTWEALDGIRTIADDATRIFDEFNDMLDRVRTRPADGALVPSLQQRFQWCFKKHRVTYLLAQLDAHKMSLSVLQQILQLGRLMASTSRHDPQDEVLAKQELIKQERAEAQNILIVRYWQMTKLDRLFEASRREDEDDKIAATEHHEEDLTHINSTDSSQLTIQAAPPEYAAPLALVKLPNYSFGELDQTLHKIKQSSKDMVQVSGEAIDPLLDRWTRWYDVREKRHAHDSGSSSRYVPSVDHLNEDEEDRPYYERYREREDSPKGFYLEGTTTDWRKPHSLSAKQEFARRRQKYSQYQASVSAASSDVDDSPGSTASKKKKKSPRHHIIDSASESSDSEHEQPRIRIRRGSSSPTKERKIVYPEGPPLSHSFSAGQGVPRRGVSGPQPGSPAPSIGSRLGPSPHLAQQRPLASPDQSMHHSVSSPLPPIHTANAPNPYANTNQPYSPYANYYYPPHPPGQQTFSAAQARYAPPAPAPLSRMQLPPRPVSQDGKGGRSPSRASYPPVYPQAPSAPRQYSKTAEPKKASKKENLREGATKGLLGAGAIAGFLEALEGLSI